MINTVQKFHIVVYLLIFVFVSSLVASSLLRNTPATNAATTGNYVFGTLQSNTTNAADLHSRGITIATVSLRWKDYETANGSFDQTYINSKIAEINTFKAAGQQVILSFGVQYPPDWLFTAYSHTYYKNQYGDLYQPITSGKKISNMIFNNYLRLEQSAYMQRVFQDLGTDFYGVRLGGGWYGELNYPEHVYNSHNNSYWAYDEIAQGNTTFDYLPAGLTAVPAHIKGWIPGTTSTNNQDARDFAEWYMNALDNYHDWQITAARQYYSGRLLMLYPSWGIRGNQLENAILGDLSGLTSAESNGEVPRGFDFSRFINGITDQNVVLYTTWIDAPFGNDASADVRDWTPAHYLTSLGTPLGLQVFGENTGTGDLADMQRSFEKVETYNLMGLIWAFEPDLYSGTYATVDEYTTLVQTLNPTSTPTPTSTATATPIPTTPIASITPTATTVVTSTATPTITATSTPTVSVTTNPTTVLVATSTVAITSAPTITVSPSIEITTSPIETIITVSPTLLSTPALSQSGNGNWIVPAAAAAIILAVTGGGLWFFVIRRKQQ